MKFKQGDIVIVDFPFTDESGSKERPALVLSNIDCGINDSDYVLCPITSNVRLTSCSVLLENKKLSRSLPKESEIRCNKISTIANSLIKHRISEIIDNSLLTEIRDKIKGIF